MVLQRVRVRLSLVVVVVLLLVCVLQIGASCACFLGQPVQVVQGLGSSVALPPMVQWWPLVAGGFAAIVALWLLAPVLPRGRASPALLQRFLI